LTTAAGAKEPTQGSGRPRQIRRVSAAMITAGVFAIAAVTLLGYLFDVLLLIFAGVLLAVVFRAPAAWISQRTRLSPPWALALVLLLISVTLAAAGWILGSAVKEQAHSVAEQVPKMLQQVQERVASYGWLGDRIDPGAALEDQSNFLGRGLRVVSATFGAIANLGLVLFMAVLFAAQPALYVRGTLRLVPKSKRKRAGEVIARIEETLRRWLLGQLLLMVFVGVTSTLGLRLLGVDSALALGMLAGLLTFVPFIGPLAAAAIAILVSLGDGLTTAAWVAALYIGIQAVEGVLEPIVQQRAVYLPPVLLLVSQLVFGVMVGALGVILATPLAAAAMVAVQMLYVEDVLGDSMKSGDP
jgi:predicted PurR-regulated permease PerM